MKPEHIHPDWSEDGEDRLRRIIRSEILSRGASVNYQEFPVSLVKWVAGGIMALTVAGITGLVILFGEVQAMRAELTALRSEITDVKRIIEPRYRGAPEDSNAH
jgi:hypothetical protein